MAVVATEQAWAWVDGWLRAKHGGSPLTYTRYAATWRRLKAYLDERGVKSFAEISRQACFDYYLHRKASRNTIGYEVRILSLICQEACHRGLLNANPARGLNVRRLRPKLKPEIPPELMDELTAIIDGMKRTPYKHFFRMSFLIGRYHGLRLSETRFPLSQVNFAADTLTIRMKGDRLHTVLMHGKVRAELEKLRNQGAAWTFAEPSDPRAMADLWHRFFKRKGLRDKWPGLCFHCLRVSVISQLARANISELKAMKFVNHSSEAVHAIYARVKVADMADCLSALK